MYVYIQLKHPNKFQIVQGNEILEERTELEDGSTNTISMTHARYTNGARAFVVNVIFR